MQHLDPFLRQGGGGQNQKLLVQNSVGTNDMAVCWLEVVLPLKVL